MDKTNFSAFCLIVLVAFVIAMCSFMFVGYTINNENIAFADSIINLTNTTWIFNSDLGSFNDVGYFNITYTSNNTSYTDIYIGVDASDVDPASNQIYYVYRVYNSGWVDDSYRTITITGGSDVSNSTLINFMLNHATLYVPDDSDTITDLTGYTWVGNNVLSDISPYGTDIESRDGMTENYSLNFTCNNVSYTYFNVIDRDYSPYGYFYSNEAYMGDGAITQVYYNGSWVSDTYKTIQITGGADATVSALITWFSNNGTLTASSNPEPDEPSEPSQDYLDGYDDGYEQGYKDGVIHTGFSSYFTGSLLQLYTEGLVQLGNKKYVSYVSETDSETIDDYTYNAQYYDTQGDDTGNIYNGFVLSPVFTGSIRIDTILYGSSSRWSQVGFKILCFNTSDNSYFYVGRDDTEYYVINNQIALLNGYPFLSVSFNIEFPSSSEYKVAFVPITDNYDGSVGSSDSSTMLIWNNTYIYSSVSGDLTSLVAQAYDDGYYLGNIRGRASGYSEGLDRGYSLGVADSQDYTFLGLMSAVVEAPVNVVFQMLDFEVLGFNIKVFFYSMISVALFIFILKLFI